MEGFEPPTAWFVVPIPVVNKRFTTQSLNDGVFPHRTNGMDLKRYIALMMMLFVQANCLGSEVGRNPNNECEIALDFYDEVKPLTRCSARQIGVGFDLRQIWFEVAIQPSPEQPPNIELICTLSERVSRCGIPEPVNCEMLELALLDRLELPATYCATARPVSLIQPAISLILDSY